MTTAMTTLSPSTSPRLPSPPPFPEVQIGLRSPTLSESQNSTSPGLPPSACSPPELADAAKVDDAASKRVRPGTKAATIATGPPLIPLAELDSPFQLQEHLKALYYHHSQSTKPNATMALSRETAIHLATPPSGIDRALWLYELCRLLVMEANVLVVAMQAEEPPCSAQTCPEMRASEWQYLCAVHDPPKSCCAIDYCCHTLDWAANVLTSQKNFPSRLTLGSETGGGPQQGLRQLTNIYRRVYRIFAHAWFQHRASFWEVEGRKGLYILFKTVCDTYGLIQEENYTVPPEAEGISTLPEEGRETHAVSKKIANVLGPRSTDDSDVTTTTISTGATTRRHNYTPSTGSVVAPIAEGDEDDSSPSAPSDKENTHTPTVETASPQPLINPENHDTKLLENKEQPAQPVEASEPHEATVTESVDTIGNTGAHGPVSNSADEPQPENTSAINTSVVTAELRQQPETQEKKAESKTPEVLEAVETLETEKEPTAH